MALHGKGGCSVGAGVEDDVEVDVGVGGCVSLVCRVCFTLDLPLCRAPLGSAR